MTSFEMPASTGVHGPGRDDQVGGRGQLDLFERDLVVADDPQVDARVDLAQPLDQVVGERVVVVDQQDHDRTAWRGSETSKEGRNRHRPSIWIVTSRRSDRKRTRHDCAAAGIGRVISFTLDARVRSGSVTRLLVTLVDSIRAAATRRLGETRRISMTSTIVTMSLTGHACVRPGPCSPTHHHDPIPGSSTSCRPGRATVGDFPTAIPTIMDGSITASICRWAPTARPSITSRATSPFRRSRCFRRRTTTPSRRAASGTFLTWVAAVIIRWADRRRRRRTCRFLPTRPTPETFPVDRSRV